MSYLLILLTPHLLTSSPSHPLTFSPPPLQKQNFRRDIRTGWARRNVLD